jgi:hypothetical protein
VVVGQVSVDIMDTPLVHRVRNRSCHCKIAEKATVVYVDWAVSIHVEEATNHTIIVVEIAV